MRKNTIFTHIWEGNSVDYCDTYPPTDFRRRVLDITLIPMLGITGAAVATLLTMTLNAVLAYRVLNRTIDVRLEYPPVHNILVASTMMGLFASAYRLIVPLSSIWLTLVPVAVGAAIYGVVLLKLDRGIHDELQAMAAQLGVRLPRWL